MKKRLLPVIAVAALIALMQAPRASSAALELSYNIAEARAYAYRISVTKEVIQAAGLNPCDPADDPYGCDKYRYEQAPNCLPAKAVAATPEPPGGGTPLSGGAGYKNAQTSGREPHKASPVKINELVTVGQLTRAGPSMGAGGVASDTFVDLDGRANPNAHTESDAFVSNKHPHEERCDPVDGGSYVHVLSRSQQSPESYSFAECFEQHCSRSGSTEGRPAARRAYSIVHLYEQGGKVFGKLKAFVSNMTFGSGAQSAGVESVTTFVTFESNGTPSGLRWTAVTTASGVSFAGQPGIALRPGDTIELPGGAAFIGVAGPYVVSSQDGSQLLMVAPGLFYSTNEQTTYAAGAEARAGFSRAEPFSFSSSLFSSSNPSLGLFRPGPGQFSEGGEFVDPSALPAAPALNDQPLTLSVRRLATAPWPLASMIGFGAFALLVLLAGWMQRFGWVRKLFDLQPLRSINWMYRAFVRT